MLEAPLLGIEHDHFSNYVWSSLDRDHLLLHLHDIASQERFRSVL